MPDEPDETTGDEQEGSTATDDRPLAGAAAQSALKKERKARADAEREAKELKSRLKALEDAEKSEVERLRSELDELQREREAERQALHTEREARKRAELVRRFATEFADADDVVALLAHRGELDDIDDESDAKRALKALATEKPHLLKKAAAPDTSTLDQVLQDGLPVDKSPGAGRTDIIPQAKLLEMSAEDIAVLKIRDPKLFERSMDALAGQETYHTVQ